MVGRVVKIARWEHAQFLAAYAGRLPICRVPRGRVTHIEMTSDGERDVWVRLEGLNKEFAFDPSQLELVRKSGRAGLRAGNDCTAGRVGS